MLDWIKENSTAFAVAVVLHLLFLTALLVNWHMDKPEHVVLEQGEIIQVSAVDASSYDAELKKIEQKKRAEQRKKADAIRKAKAREEAKKKKKQQEIRTKKEQQRRLEELKRKQALEKKKKAEKKKAQQEKERKKAEQKKKIAEQKRQQEKKKKAAQEKQRLEQKKKQQIAEQKRQAEVKLKEQRQRAEKLRRSKGIINRHVALISKKIEHHWRQPLNFSSGLQCKVEISLLHSGKVTSVKVVESSGDREFDRSVENAVRRASPLPVPTDSVIFKEFEIMILRFEPGSY